MIQALEARGHRPVHAPGLTIEPVAEAERDRRVEVLDRYRAVIVTSPTAARLLVASPSLPRAASIRWFAPGTGTASILRGAGIDCRHPPVGGTSESLLRLPELRSPTGMRIAIVGAPGGRRLLEHELQRRGARVDYCFIYQRRALTRVPALVDALAGSRPPVVLLSSGRILDTLLDALSDEQRACFKRARFIVSSARLADKCRAVGLVDIVRADGADDESMLDALDRPDWPGANDRLRG